MGQMLLTGAGGGASTLGLKTNLVAWWELNEASGSRSDSHTNALTLTDNNTVTNAAGIGGVGTSALFTQSNAEWLSVADNAALNYTTQMSISLWVYVSTFALPQTLVSQWAYQTDGCFSFFIGDFGAGSYRLQQYIAGTPTDVGNNRQDGTAGLSADTWYHIGMVYDGSLALANRVKFFINASADTVSIGACPTSLLNSAADLNLGKFGGSLTRYHNGRMAKVGIWNTALTPTQITQLYNAGAGRTYAEL